MSGNCLSSIVEEPERSPVVCFEALFRGPVLSLFAMAGWAACDRAEFRREGQREARFRGVKGDREAQRVPDEEGGRCVEMAVGFADDFLSLAFDWSRM